MCVVILTGLGQKQMKTLSTWKLSVLWLDQYRYCKCVLLPQFMAEAPQTLTSQGCAKLAGSQGQSPSLVQWTQQWNSSQEEFPPKMAFRLQRELHDYPIISDSHLTPGVPWKLWCLCVSVCVYLWHCFSKVLLVCVMIREALQQQTGLPFCLVCAFVGANCYLYIRPATKEELGGTVQGWPCLVPS